MLDIYIKIITGSILTLCLIMMIDSLFEKLFLRARLFFKARKFQSNLELGRYSESQLLKFQKAIDDALRINKLVQDMDKED